MRDLQNKDTRDFEVKTLEPSSHGSSFPLSLPEVGLRSSLPRATPYIKLVSQTWQLWDRWTPTLAISHLSSPPACLKMAQTENFCPAYNICLSHPKRLWIKGSPIQPSLAGAGGGKLGCSKRPRPDALPHSLGRIYELKAAPSASLPRPPTPGRGQTCGSRIKAAPPPERDAPNKGERAGSARAQPRGFPAVR